MKSTEPNGRQKKLHPNEYGRIAEKEWIKTSKMRPNVRLDVFVIMPNHMHGIIEIADGRGTMHRAPTVEWRWVHILFQHF